MNAILKIKLDDLKAELQNLEFSIQNGNKDEIERSTRYIENDLRTIRNFSQNASPEQIQGK